MLKHTEKDHSDYSALGRALETMQEVATNVDQAVVLEKNRVKVVTIQQNLAGYKSVKNIYYEHLVYF